MFSPSSSANGASAVPHQASDRDVGAAIMRTVTYVDVFDYPLTEEEVHRYLVSVAAPVTVVRRLLREKTKKAHLGRLNGYYTLPGREEIVEIRRRREATARRLWPQALHYGDMIANLPFVRMVAVTGSLAVNNVVADADIDYLIVTEAGRLWLARALTILVVKYAARRGVHLCPNYFLATTALAFADQNLYTAHELVQMVPISGTDAYRRIREANPWTQRFLPNAMTPHHVALHRRSRFVGWLGALGEVALRTPPGTWLEKWEMERKISKLTRRNDSVPDSALEAAFCPDWCKGHFDGHGHRIMDAYTSRMQSIL